MNAGKERSDSSVDPDGLTTSERAALLHFLEAYDESAGLDDARQFALELPGLRKAGIHDSILRGLVRRGLLKHAQETTRPGAARRSMRPTANLHFTEQSCFMLTEAGVEAARKPSTVGTASAAPRPSEPVDRAPAAKLPSFVKCDDGRRELRWGEEVAKVFRTYAGEQECILNKFEEEGWKTRIDNPLELRAGRNPKKHLRDVIFRLNRHQVKPLICFYSDGNGTGVRWERTQR